MFEIEYNDIVYVRVIFVLHDAILSTFKNTI